MPKVSVIVPFFNAEKFIGRCARSLFAQTLDDMEFIFVDDCSSDCSVGILNDVRKEFPERESQVTVLKNSENLGCPLSRMQGLPLAGGEYVIFCDGDDEVEPQMYELMYKEALRGDFDMVICDFDRIRPDGSSVPASPQKPSDDLLDDLLRGRLYNYLWNKLIRRSILDIPFVHPTANVWEDVAFISQFAVHCRKVSWIDSCLYHYYVNQNSLMNGVLKKKRVHDMVANVQIVEEFLKSQGLMERYGSALVRHKAYILSECFDTPRKEYLSLYPEVRFRLFFSPDVEFSKKMGHLTKLLGIHGISGIFR